MSRNHGMGSFETQELLEQARELRWQIEREQAAAADRARSHGTSAAPEGSRALWVGRLYQLLFGFVPGLIVLLGIFDWVPLEIALTIAAAAVFAQVIVHVEQALRSISGLPPELARQPRH